MSQPFLARSVTTWLLAGSVAVLATGCGTTPPSKPVPEPTVEPSPLVSSGQSPAGTAAVPSTEASPGFAFDPESIAGYFATIGYTCTPRQLSTSAVGHEFQSCQLVDTDGRTRTVGLVTDPADNLADAFLRVRGTDTEAVVDPAAVLDPFAAFLGAVLGESLGAAELPWVAAHLGDADARTTVGTLTIATYTPAQDDHTTLTVEIANQAYLDTPVPSGAAR